MRITEHPEPSIWYILGFSVVCLLLGGIALYYALIVSNDLIDSISGGDIIFTFDKGAFYMYGVSICLLAISIGLVFYRVFKFNKEKVESVVTRFLFISVAVLIILPQAMHFYIDSYTEKNNYQICRDQSHRWLHAVTIVYAKNGRCLDK